MGTLLNDSEYCLTSSIAQEVNRLAGTIATIYQFDEVESTLDPYYAEVAYAKYKRDGVKCPVIFKNPDDTPISGEEGLRAEYSPTLFVATADLKERKLREPRIGDIFQVWGAMFKVTDITTANGRFSENGDIAEYEISLSRKTKDISESVQMTPQKDIPSDNKI